MLNSIYFCTFNINYLNSIFDCNLNNAYFNMSSWLKSPQPNKNKLLIFFGIKI